MRLVALEEHYGTDLIADANRSEPYNKPYGISARVDAGPGSAPQTESYRRHLAGMIAARDGRPVPGNPGIFEALRDVGAGRIADMDAAGIDFQVVSHTVPATETLPPALALDLARRANDDLAERVALHPSRLGGFATLPTPAPEAAADELERAVTGLGFKGAMLNGTVRGRFLDDRFFWPIFAKAEGLGVPIYLHPAYPPANVIDTYYAGFSPVVSASLSSSAWGWHVETGLHALRLVLGGVFDAFPRLQVIIGHMGEAVPFMLARSERALPQEATGLEHRIGEYFTKHFFVTTSGFFTLPPFLCALQVMGVDRVLFSVDYPYSRNTEGRSFFDSLPLDEVDREKIGNQNAEQLMAL